jgi:hypothetical protein
MPWATAKTTITRNTAAGGRETIPSNVPFEVTKDELKDLKDLNLGQECDAPESPGKPSRRSTKAAKETPPDDGL